MEQHAENCNNQSTIASIYFIVFVCHVNQRHHYAMVHFIDDSNLFYLLFGAKILPLFSQVSYLFYQHKLLLRLKFEFEWFEKLIESNWSSHLMLICDFHFSISKMKLTSTHLFHSIEFYSENCNALRISLSLRFCHISLKQFKVWQRSEHSIRRRGSWKCYFDGWKRIMSP